MTSLIAKPTRLIVIVGLGVATALGFAAAGVSATSTPSSPPNDYVRAVQYVSATSPSSKGDTKTATATCPSGKAAIGGGGDVKRTVGAYSIVTSKPVVPATPTSAGGWTVTATGVSLSRGA
jgi:hypothetical protein